MDLFLGRCLGDTVYGEAPSTFAATPTSHTGVPPMKDGSHPRVCVRSKRGSKFLVMFTEIKLAVHFIESKGCICSLGEEAHLVSFH